MKLLLRFFKVNIHFPTFNLVYSIRLSKIRKGSFSHLFIVFFLLSFQVKAQENVISLLWGDSEGVQAGYFGVPTALDDNENFYRAGKEINTAGGTNARLQKWNPDGDLIWDITLNDVGQEFFEPSKIVVENSSIFISGIMRNIPTGNADIFVAEVDEDGAIQWFTLENVDGDDIASDLIYDQASSALYVCGTTNRNGSYDVLLSHYDPSGVLQWTITEEFNGNADIGAKVNLNGSNIMVNGSSQSTTTQWDIVSWIFDNAGNLINEERSTGTTTASDELTDGVLNNGYINLSGYTILGGQSDFKVLCLDASNNILWQDTYDKNGLNDQGSAIIASTYGFAVAGHVTPSMGDEDILLRQYDLQGNLIWHAEFDHSGGVDRGVDILEDKSGNLLVLSDVSVDGQTDVFLYYVEGSTGSLIWDERISEDATQNEHSISIESNLEGEVFITYEIGGESHTKTYAYSEVHFAYDPEPISKSILFITNTGQVKDANNESNTNVKYYSRGIYPDFFFSDDYFSAYLNNFTDDGTANDFEQRIDITFAGSIQNGRVSQVMENKNPTLFNYYLGEEKYEGKQTFDVISYPDIYKNINAFIYSNSEGFKMSFVLEQGADINDIELNVNGASGLYTNGGKLYIETIEEDIVLMKPLSYWESGNANGDNCVDYILEEGNLKFVTTCDVVYPYVIQLRMGSGQQYSTSSIGNLEWSTFYGGNDDDGAFDVEVNNSGDIFIGGFTKSTAFPQESNVNPTNLSGKKQAMVVKFNHNAQELWVTLMAPGGSGNSNAATIKGIKGFENLTAVNGTEIHFIGEYTGLWSSSVNINAGIPSGAYQQNNTPMIHNPNRELFFGTLRSNGNLLFTTPFGGAEKEKVHTLDISPNGIMYFGGSTEGGSSASSSSPIPPSSHTFPVYDPQDGSFFEASHPNSGNEKRGFVTAVDLNTYQLTYSSLITKDPGTSNTPFEAIYDIDLKIGVYCGKGIAYARMGQFNTTTNKFAPLLDQTYSEWTDKTYFNSVSPSDFGFVLFGIDAWPNNNDPLLTNPAGLNYQNSSGEAYLVRFYEGVVNWDTYFGGSSGYSWSDYNMNGSGFQVSNFDEAHDLNGKGKIAYNSAINSYFIAASDKDYKVDTKSNGSYFYENGVFATEPTMDELYIGAFSSNKKNTKDYFNWGTMYGGSDGGSNNPPYSPPNYHYGRDFLSDIYAYNVGNDSYVLTVATSYSGQGSTTGNTEDYPVADLGKANSWFKANNNSSFTLGADIVISRFVVNNLDYGVSLNEPNIISHLKLFPNPVNNILHLQLLDDEDVNEVKIYDLSGKIVVDEIYNDPTESVDIEMSHLVTGMYLITVNGQHNQKFLKL